MVKKILHDLSERAMLHNYIIASSIMTAIYRLEKIYLNDILKAK